MDFMQKTLFSWFSYNICNVIGKLEGAIILPTTKKIMHAKMCNNIVKTNPCFCFYVFYTQRKTSCFCDLSSNDLTSVHM